MRTPERTPMLLIRTHDSIFYQLRHLPQRILPFRYNLGLEILALRQQLGILKRKQPHSRLRIQDRIFWIMLRPLNVAIRLWYLCVAEPSVRRQIPFTSVS